MANLEGQLGELTGYLRAMGPALDRIEERQNEADKKAAGAEAKHEGLRAEFNELRTKFSNRVGDVYTKMAAIQTQIDHRTARIESAEKEIQELKAKNDGFKQKAWDLLKIIVTIVLTLVVGRMFGKA